MNLTARGETDWKRILCIFRI